MRLKKTMQNVLESKRSQFWKIYFWAGQTITREFLISLTMIEKQALKEYVIETS